MVSLNSQDVLREIAKQIGSRVSKCENYDPNVCDFEPDPTDIAKVIATFGQPFRIRTTYRLAGQKIRLYANDEFLEIQVPFESDLDRISVNRPDKVSFLALAGVMPVDDREYRLFTEKAALTERHSRLMKDDRFKKLVRAIQPSRQEGVHFSLGDVRIYLRYPSKERVLSITKETVTFLGVQTQYHRTIEVDDLPSQFNPLLALVQTWGITDDAEREERRQDVPRVALQALVEEVRPYLHAINSYLDSFGEQPLPESAIALGALAEFAVETDLYLNETRNSTQERS